MNVAIGPIYFMLFVHLGFNLAPVDECLIHHTGTGHDEDAFELIS